MRFDTSHCPRKNRNDVGLVLGWASGRILKVESSAAIWHHVMQANISVRQGTYMDKQPAVYILASKRNGTLYIGVTSELRRRIWQHKNNVLPGFTNTYGVHSLVYYELHGSMRAAIEREKKIKKWKRAWKLDLIETSNPEWRDLWEDICAD
jgi:putative endonuclease